ncbi:relaxase [Streptomyces sp. NPDC050610]|uniref:relaxase n=1 Tax=Streptomyces sp. NPDC050610 TaxID=3157097 RepID=UPI003426476F
MRGPSEPKHRPREHRQQAEAARQTITHLRTAYQAAATEPLTTLRQRGARLAETLRRRQENTLRRALPDLAEQILAEPGWPALAATLARTEAVGHKPTARRETATATATGLSEVPTWRLHRLADLTAYTTSSAPAPRSAAYRPTNTGGSRGRAHRPGSMTNSPGTPPRATAS